MLCNTAQKSRLIVGGSLPPLFAKLGDGNIRTLKNMKVGGKRANSGAKKKDPKELKKGVTIYVRQATIDHLGGMSETKDFLNSKITKK